MYLMIDNYDSFVYNLVTYFQELNWNMTVKRHDAVTKKTVAAMNPAAIVISPGPKTPGETGACLDIINEFKGKIPILGVCLGHQTIAHAFGGLTRKGQKPVHGKVTPIVHNGTGLFTDLPSSYKVTRYHSLVVEETTLPQEIQVDAWGENGEIMAISHRLYPIYGVQFHPEAVLTQYGHELLINFQNITQEWWWRNDKDNQRIAAL